MCFTKEVGSKGGVYVASDIFRVYFCLLVLLGLGFGLWVWVNGSRVWVGQSVCGGVARLGRVLGIQASGVGWMHSSSSADLSFTYHHHKC